MTSITSTTKNGTTTITLPDGETVSIPDTITLTRSVQGDDYPRMYTLTGKPFADMLAAVKALPERSYDGLHKVWKVRQTGIDALKAQGLTVQVARPVRVEHTASRSPLTQRDGDVWTIRATLTVEVRRDVGDTGWWAVARAYRTIQVPHADVAAARRRECERLDLPYRGETSNHDQTAERLALDSLKPLADEVIAAFEAARNKGYTKAAYRAGRDAAQATLAAAGLEQEGDR